MTSTPLPKREPETRVVLRVDPGAKAVLSCRELLQQLVYAPSPEAERASQRLEVLLEVLG